MSADRPTAKPKRQRVDETTWLLFVRACGGRCCVCFKDGPLHRGHIQRHADGGQAKFANLIPLCKSCNSKYKDGFTPDHRPAGWQDNFLKLLLVDLSLGIMCQHVEGRVNTSRADKNTETMGLIDARDVKFVPLIHYSTHPVAPSSNTLEPMPPQIAEQLMRELVRQSKATPIRPKPPTQKRQDQMKQAAIRVGAEAFRIAGAEFLQTEPEPWLIGTGDRAYAHADSWQHFCDSFDMYLDDGRERAVRRAEQAKREREQRAVWQKEQEANLRERRWKDYLLAADVPSYPGIPAADVEYIVTVVADKGKETRCVSEEQYERSLEVYRHWKHYVKDELLTEKNRLRGLLEECRRWAQRFNRESQMEYSETIGSLSDWVDRTQTIEELKEDSYPIDNLHGDLDPSRPPFDPDTDSF